MDVQIRFPTIDPLIVRLKQAPRIVREEQRRGVTRASLLVEADAKRAVVVDTSHLRRSITHRIETRGNDIVGVVGSNLPYARVVEEGRSAGAAMPPSGALLAWMRRKGIDEGFEFVIRRAIGRRGTKPQPYLVPALEKNRDRIVRELGVVTAERIVTRLKAGR